MITTLFIYFLNIITLASKIMQVEIHNDSNQDRISETVEIPWDEIKGNKISPENVIVINNENHIITSQVVYEGKKEPQSLIFQVSLPAHKKSCFTIKEGKRKEYNSLAKGRYVPERMGDYAWENDIMGYRLYSTSLKSPKTSGIDIFCKKTSNMVLDKWYSKGNYHIDHGEGMDCYTVGPTLGAGSSGILTENKLLVGENFSKFQTLDNGPIRTSFKLTYPPIIVNGKQITRERYISLDAGSFFNKIIDIYEGDFKSLNIGIGHIQHDIIGTFKDKNYFGTTEWASFSKNPQKDGAISIASIVLDGKQIKIIDGNIIKIKTISPGDKNVYWAGAGWEKNGVNNNQKWKNITYKTYYSIKKPLKIKIK